MRKPPIENVIYASIIGLCEEKEYDGVYRGNGHHLAQELTVKISAGLLVNQQKKIYDAMSTSPKTSKEIGLLCDLSSKQVSAQLGEISKNTLLIGCKSQGRLKLWYKY